MASSQITTECKRYGCMKNLLACYANCKYNTRCDELRREVEGKLDQAAGDINAYLVERGGGPITIQLPKRGLKFSDTSKLRSPVAGRQKRETVMRAPLMLTSVVAKPQPAGKEPDRKETGKKSSRKKNASASLKPESSSPPRAKRLSKAKKTASIKLNKRQDKKTEVKRAALPTGASQAGRRKVAPKRRLRKIGIMSRKAKSVTDASVTSPEQVSALAPKEREAALNQPANGKRAASRKKKSRGATASSGNHKSKTYIVLEGNSATIVDEQGLMLRILNGSTPGARYFEATEVEAKIQITAKR